MKIVVVGAGYVGLSVAAVLGRVETVVLVDIDEEKIKTIASGKSPFKDEGLDCWLREHDLDLRPTLDAQTAYKNAEFVIVAVPTSYDNKLRMFDTSHVDSVVEEVVKMNPQAVIVIKSTIPEGYTDRLSRKYPKCRFLFSPEFLREGHALYDNVHPTRIVVGIPQMYLDDEKMNAAAWQLAGLLSAAALDEHIPVFVMSASESESVKLFANTYLAMRVAFFNELDTYAMAKRLNTSHLIEGICSDPRIGNHYNNPSFGYGGYCLPKDSKQLLANFQGIPQNIVTAVVDSNATRKSVVVQDIVERVHACSEGDPAKRTGVYRLVMKSGADNFRSSSVVDIVDKLQKAGLELLVYEPLIEGNEYRGIPVEKNLEKFKDSCCCIIANRMDDSLLDVSEKVYTRDLFNRD